MNNLDKVLVTGNRIQLQCSREYIMIPESRIETGTGAIYKATDTYFGRNVAVKLVHIEGENPRERDNALNNAKREVRSIIRICNSTDLPVPRIYDEAFDAVNNDYYIIMDWIDGQNLRDYINGEGQYKNLSQFLFYMRDLCDIVGRLNTRKMFHKDIKPENIIINDRKVYLIDFNISGNVANRQEGTMYYKAPEMDYNSRNPDRTKVDIFAIGVILYEYFLGRAPMPGSEYTVDKMGIKKDWRSFAVPMDRIAELRAENGEGSMPLVMSKEISDIIMKAMAFDPNQRYKKAWDMKNDISSVIKKLKK